MTFTPKNAEQIWKEWLVSMRDQTADPTVEGFETWLKQSLISFLEDVKGRMPTKPKAYFSERNGLKPRPDYSLGFDEAIDSCLSVINSIQSEITK